MVHLPHILSFALPGLLFIHSCWRILVAGSLKSKFHALVPSMVLAISSLWLAKSASAAMGQGLSAEALSAQVSFGLSMTLILLFLTEAPFWVSAHARRPKRVKPTRK